MEQLEKEQNEWKKNTVLTLLSRLIEKQFLKTKKIGRRNEYVAVVTEQEYQTMQTHNFLDKVYGGDVKHLVSALLQQDMLSADELKEIERFWAKQNEWVDQNNIIAFPVGHVIVFVDISIQTGI